MKGSGLPIRIPVIEMVEIGAGGGSIARVDDLERVQVGPDSAGPSPARMLWTRRRPCDRDRRRLRDGPAGSAAICRRQSRSQPSVRKPRSCATRQAAQSRRRAGALAITEIVTENMANAARVHAMELGKTVETIR